MKDLAVIIVSTNEARWLRPCLETLFGKAGALDLDVVVADNQSTDGTRELVESDFPRARVVTCENKGFAHANNRALQTCDARYVLFLNPDTELVSGTLAELVRSLDERPTVGVAGVRQLTGDGALFPTIRYFPNALRALCEVLGSERWPVRGTFLGERELDLSLYDEERACDWTSGSFFCVRREALESAGFLDERFFIYSEETDLCLRIKQAGWEVRHLPTMTIVHHAEKAGVRPKLAAQDAFTRRQYARKHFSPAHRALYFAALELRYATRWVAAAFVREGGNRRSAAWRAMKALLGLEAPPFGPPPAVAVATHADDAVDDEQPRTVAALR